MSTSLPTIIDNIKTAALATGYKSVEELKLNMKANSDTLLPKLFIKLTGISYDKLQVNAAVETYKLELTTVIADSANPSSDLKARVDGLLNNLFNVNALFQTLARGSKVILEDSDLSNDRDVYSKYGGESFTLRMNITNINTFGGTPCQ